METGACGGTGRPGDDRAASIAARVQLVYPESLAESTLERMLEFLVAEHRRAVAAGDERAARPSPTSPSPTAPAATRTTVPAETPSTTTAQTPSTTPAATRTTVPADTPSTTTAQTPSTTPATRPGSASPHPSAGLTTPSPAAELPFESADRLAAAAPGPDLAQSLAALEHAALDVDGIVEAIAAWERLMSWAAAHQAVLLRSLVAHEDGCGRRDFAADAVATRLHVTRHAARRTLERALLLGTFPEVSELLATGGLTASKADTIVTAVADAPNDLQQTILDTVLPTAPDVTGPTIRNRIRTAAATLDPGVVQARAAAEAERRCVTLTPAPDAMAYLTFYLPADQASTCLTAIDAIATAARTPEDARSADARRVDALADLLRRVLDAGRTPSGVELPTQQHRRPHIQVTVAATTLLGLDQMPAELAGYGPIPADMARRIAADGTWRRLVVNPATGQVSSRDATTYRPGADLAGTVVSRDQTCAFPGCRVPAWRCDLDHVEAFRHGEDAAAQTTAENLHPLCRHHHRLKTHTEWTVRRDPVTGRTTWTTPWGREYVREPEHPAGLPAPAPGAPAGMADATGETRESEVATTGGRADTDASADTDAEPSRPADLGPPPF